MTVAASPSPLARAWSARWPFAAEIVLFLVLNVTYEWLRDLVVAPADGLGAGSPSLVDLDRVAASVPAGAGGVMASGLTSAPGGSAPL